MKGHIPFLFTSYFILLTSQKVINYSKIYVGLRVSTYQKKLVNNVSKLTDP